LNGKNWNRATVTGTGIAILTAQLRVTALGKQLKRTGVKNKHTLKTK